MVNDDHLMTHVCLTAWSDHLMIVYTHSHVFLHYPMGGHNVFLFGVPYEEHVYYMYLLYQSNRATNYNQ